MRRCWTRLGISCALSLCGGLLPLRSSSLPHPFNCCPPRNAGVGVVAAGAVAAPEDDVFAALVVGVVVLVARLFLVAAEAFNGLLTAEVVQVRNPFAEPGIGGVSWWSC